MDGLMRLIYAGIFLTLLLIAALFYWWSTPSSNEGVTSTVNKAGVVKGMPLYAPPSGHTTQDLNGVPGVETYQYPENGGL